MEWRIKQLVKSLTLLGYCSFEIKSIAANAIGTDSMDDISIENESLIIGQLEHYEQLGSLFQQTYSK